VLAVPVPGQVEVEVTAAVLVVKYAGLGYYVASTTANDRRTSSDGTRCP
jgi:hypothetical protein